MFALKDFEVKLSSRTFIEKAFDAFENVRKSENGISKLRLRKGEAKKLVEEILPIAEHVPYYPCFPRHPFNV